MAAVAGIITSISTREWLSVKRKLNHLDGLKKENDRKKQVVNDKEKTSVRKNNPQIERIKLELLEIVEKRLRERYPDGDAWRPPSNFADTMGCVGCAQAELDNYKRALEEMSDEEVVNLYKEFMKKKHHERIKLELLEIEEKRLRERYPDGLLLLSKTMRYSAPLPSTPMVSCSTSLLLQVVMAITQYDMPSRQVMAIDSP